MRQPEHLRACIISPRDDDGENIEAAKLTLRQGHSWVILITKAKNINAIQIHRAM